MSYRITRADEATPGDYIFDLASEDAHVQSLDAATLTAKTLNADGTDTTVAFGASNGTAKSGAVYAAGLAAGGIDPDIIVSADWVVVGHDNYAGGQHGSYPTTASSKSDQHTTDAAFLAAHLDEQISANDAIRAEFSIGHGTASVGGGSGLVLIVNIAEE